MKIETKFKPGDKLWTISSDGKAYEFTVGSVTVSVLEDGAATVFYYEQNSGYSYTSHEEKMCFAGREELADYIFSGSAK